jgi:hypothetical protein
VSGSTGWAITSDGTAEFQNATIRGSLNASDITAGTLSSDRLDTDFIAVGGAASDVNSGSTTIDGGNITTNSITTNQLNFTPYQDGEDIDSGTLGGITIDSDNIRTTNYSSTQGFRIESDGDAFFNDVTARGTISGTVDTTLSGGSSGFIQSSTGANRVRVGASLGSAIDFIYSSGTRGIIEAVGTDLFRIYGYEIGDDIQIFAGGLSGQGDMELKAEGLTLSGSPNTNMTIYTPVSTKLSLSGSTGSSGQVLTSNANGMSWQNTGGHSHGNLSFPNAGTVLSDSNHSHNTSGLLDNAHLLATNPHSQYVENANHSHSNFLENADLSNHVTNSNTNFLSAVGHTAMAAGNLGVAHGLDLGNVLNSSSNGGGTHHSHGNTMTPNAHNHSYANSGHTHDYANSVHGHGNSYLSNSHENGHPTNHNHPYASSTHGHGAYSVIGHSHNSNSPTINAFMHDDRFLNINANTVPGLNVVKRLNPVTANFTSGYIAGLKKYSDRGVPDSFTSMDRKTYRLTVQDVEQALTDDGIDTTDVAWLIDRLYYADRYLTEETQEKKDHGSKGLMNGEIEAVLVQAIKDLSAKIDTLENRIETLEG